MSERVKAWWELPPSGTPLLVSDEQIDALVAQGWDWHSAYRILQSSAHGAAAIRSLASHEGDKE